MKTHIIAFVAPKGYGKTTACNIIKDHYRAVQLNFKDALIKELKEKFPDLLRAILSNQNNYVEEFGPSLDVEDTLGKGYIDTIDELFIAKPPLVRTLMQNYGTEVRRKDDPDYWVLQWKLALANTNAPIVLTDDVRFKNEAEAIKAYGGTLIRIEREDLQNTDNHVSEQEQNEIVCDYTITTKDGNHAQFRDELLALVNKLVV